MIRMLFLHSELPSSIAFVVTSQSPPSTTALRVVTFSTLGRVWQTCGTSSRPLILTLPRSGLLSWLSLTRTFVFCPNVEAKTHCPHLHGIAHIKLWDTLAICLFLKSFIVTWLAVAPRQSWRIHREFSCGSRNFTSWNLHFEYESLNHHSNPGNHDLIDSATNKQGSEAYPGPRKVGAILASMSPEAVATPPFLLRGWCGMVFLSFGSFQMCQKSSFRVQSQRLDSEHSKSSQPELYTDLNQHSLALLLSYSDIAARKHEKKVPQTFPPRSPCRTSPDERHIFDKLAGTNPSPYPCPAIKHHGDVTRRN